MKSIFVSAAILLASATAAIAAPHTYQVTGPVVSVDDKTIVVTKGKEKFEISRDASSNVPADVKVGSKVTVEYFMTAKTVTVKDAGKAAKAEDKKDGAKK